MTESEHGMEPARSVKGPWHNKTQAQEPPEELAVEVKMRTELFRLRRRVEQMSSEISGWRSAQRPGRWTAAKVLADYDAHDKGEEPGQAQKALDR
jgi:hypothetical protein